VPYKIYDMSVFSTLFGFEPKENISKDVYKANDNQFDDLTSEITIPSGGMLSKEATALLAKIIADHNEHKGLEQEVLSEKPAFALQISLWADKQKYSIIQRNEKHGYGYSLAIFAGEEKKDVKALKKLYEKYKYNERLV